MDMNKVDARPFDRLWPARHEGWKTVDRQVVLVLFDALVAVARHANLEAFQDLSGAEAVVLGAFMDAPALQALAEGPVDQDFVDALRLYEAAIPDPTSPFTTRLTHMIREPLALPTLQEQLAFVASRWVAWLPESMIRALLSRRDELAEYRGRLSGPPGPPELPQFGAEGPLPERFTADRDWMAECVLIAKHTLVWLYQLSQRYGRPIERLDQIPDEEFEELRRRGFTGLWLIGLWERSHGSGEIKRRRGNSEAAASAYALWGYTIAESLGGEAALGSLRERAWRCLLYTSPSPRDLSTSRMPSSA